jgi:predicted nuclease of predicted toxin-antitoxin system
MMRFVVDAQLPRRLSKWLSSAGHDSIHTLDLPERNETADLSVAALADLEDRIVVSKDSDFSTLQLLNGSPRKLLLVKTGNLGNDSLLAIFDSNIDSIEKLFITYDIVEVSTTFLLGRNLD